jgi:hypothetical protein
MSSNNGFGASQLVTTTIKNQDLVAINGNSSSPPASNGGSLHATILSAYDLPTRDPPSCITLSIVPSSSPGSNNYQACTGPPAQRHKGRNSFKWAKSTVNSSFPNVATILAPLPVLYPSLVRVEVTYQHNPTQNLVADYALNQLKIDETTWLILNLEAPQANGSSSSPPATFTTSPLRIESDNGSTSTHTNASSNGIPPTIRLQLCLRGPYRTEIAALVRLGQSWFALVDTMTVQVHQVISKLPSLPFDYKFLVIPLVPVVAALLVLSPALAGVLVVGLPLFLPIFLLLGAILLGLATASVFLYSSTPTGRDCVRDMVQPLWNAVLTTPSGQAAIYQTGPRPTPVDVARVLLPTGPWSRLVVSLTVDALGSATYLVPAVGELGDLAWAPLQTCLIMAMYNTTSPQLKYLSFAEEILPFTDIVPTATLGWLSQHGLPLLLGTDAAPPPPDSSFHSPPRN